MLKKLRDFFDSDDKQEISFEISAYSWEKKKHAKKSYTIKKGDIVYLGSKYLNRERFAKFFNLRARLQDDQFKVDTRYLSNQEKRLKKANMNAVKYFINFVFYQVGKPIRSELSTR